MAFCFVAFVCSTDWAISNVLIPFNASSITNSGSLIARLVETFLILLPVKRCISISLSTARIIASASAISFVVNLFSVLIPCVSNFASWPSFLAVPSNFSADIYVCAIPVGHAVTPIIFIVILPYLLIQ